MVQGDWFYNTYDINDDDDDINNDGDDVTLFIGNKWTLMVTRVC